MGRLTRTSASEKYELIRLVEESALELLWRGGDSGGGSEAFVIELVREIRAKQAGRVEIAGLCSGAETRGIECARRGPTKAGIVEGNGCHVGNRLSLDW